MIATLRIAICDDECHMLKHLTTTVNEYLNKLKLDAQIYSFTSGITLLCSDEYFDIIIMDIRMAGLDGMETVCRLRAKGSRSQVIFVTSSKDYVFQAFDVDAVHYLIKPVSDQDLLHALDKAVGRCGQVDSAAVAVTRGSSVQMIPFRNILYCEAIDHKIYISTEEGKVDYYGKLDALQDRLDDRFFRCHRSYLLNMNYVSGKEKDTAIMINGDRIPISRRRQPLFSEQLLSFIRREVL